jgi:hypothetical protein
MSQKSKTQIKDKKHFAIPVKTGIRMKKVKSDEPINRYPLGSGVTNMQIG